MSAIQLLGETLLKPDGTSVSKADALAGKEVLGLYFSAHWCPPCKRFTPILSQKYLELQKAGKAFELVFVSGDRDEKDFQAYHKSMSFLALPYEERAAEEELSSMFEITGIPSLLLLDAKTGAVISRDGVEAFMEEDFLTSYPWRPKAFDFLGTVGDTLLKSDLSKVPTSDALADADVVGLYFSAHWCPPCRAFTPLLSKRYTALKAAGKKFELLFVSSDRDEKSFKEYLSKEMSFLAIPFENRAAKAVLNKQFGVEGIPTLIFLDARNNFAVITDEARGSISNEATFVQEFPYFPKAVNDVSESISKINDLPALVVFMEKASDAVKADVRRVLTAVAEADKAKPESERSKVKLYFTCDGSGGPHAMIRGKCGLDKGDQSKPSMALLHLAARGAFYLPNAAHADFSEANVLQFVKDFAEGKLSRRQFS